MPVHGLAWPCVACKAPSGQHGGPCIKCAELAAAERRFQARAEQMMLKEAEIAAAERRLQARAEQMLKEAEQMLKEAEMLKQSRSRSGSRRREDAAARGAAEPQAEECTSPCREECTCAWAHVGVHTSMCELEVEGKGKDMQLWLVPKAQLELLVRDLSRKINGSRGSSTKA